MIFRKNQEWRNMWGTKLLFENYLLDGQAYRGEEMKKRKCIFDYNKGNKEV